MKLTWTAFALLLALFVGSSPRVALADPPPAEFTVSFDGDAAIWNPFEDFQACETVTDSGLTVTMCLDVTNVFCDGAGICTCDAALDFEGDLDGLLTGNCTAKVGCKATPDNPTDPVCKAKLAFDAIGSISVLGLSCGAEILNFVVNGPVDYTGFYRGKAKAKVCVECAGGQRACTGASGLFEYAVNPPIPWDLTVQLASDPQYPNSLVGVATDSLGPFSYTAMGTYDPASDQLSIGLKGVTRKVDPNSVSQGAKIKLEELGCAAGQCGGGTATFKVQGNKVKDAPVEP
jgi:hypothetical protein